MPWSKIAPSLIMTTWTYFLILIDWMFTVHFLLLALVWKASSDDHEPEPHWWRKIILYTLQKKKKRNMWTWQYNLLQIFNIILNTDISITLHWNLAHSWLFRLYSLLKWQTLSHRRPEKWETSPSWPDQNYSSFSRMFWLSQVLLIYIVVYSTVWYIFELVLNNLLE